MDTSLEVTMSHAGTLESPSRIHLLAFALAVAAAACTPVWNPPPPVGVTYAYRDQGFVETKVGAGFGRVGPVSYGAGFGFRDRSSVNGAAVSDPFQQSVPIDGIRFNPHLAGQGVPVAPLTTSPATPTLLPTTLSAGNRS
jgi:hypothetical protein